MAEVNGEEVSKYNKANPITKEQLEATQDITLNEITQISANNIHGVNPIDIKNIDIEQKSNTLNVKSYDIQQPNEIAFKKVTVDEEVTNESINRQVDTLKKSLDMELKLFANRTIASLSGITGSVNNAFSGLKIQMDDQTSEVDKKVKLIVSKINLALQEVRDSNKEQNNDVVSQINLVSGELQANINKVKQLAKSTQDKLKALDDVYLTDSDFSQRVTAVNELIETLRNADFDIISTISKTVSELNVLLRVRTKTIVLNSANGIYDFNLVAHDLPEMDDTNYSINATIVGASKGDTSELLLTINNKTKDGVKFMVKTLNTFRPQIINGSINPITIDVTIVHKKLNPLVFDIEQLDDAWMVEGNGIDRTIMPKE